MTTDSVRSTRARKKLEKAREARARRLYRQKLQEALIEIATTWKLMWMNAADYRGLAVIEGCAHELAHALDLGLDFEDLIQDMSGEESNQHEASVLRIEVAALAKLKVHLSMRRLRTSANWDGPEGVPSRAQLRAPLNRHEQHCVDFFVHLVNENIADIATRK